MTLITGIGDWRRFERPGQVMAYLGLVPKRTLFGRTTPPGPHHEGRQQVYHRIAAKKSSRIAVVAVARELVGFLWAVMQDLEHEQLTALREAA